MSKTTKLIKSPLKYFRDSLWFKKINLKFYQEYENLFIISHLGQLNQIENLIQQENIKNNLLIILYTNKNTRVPKSIAKQVNKSLFLKINLLLLPNSPNNYKLKSLVYMNRLYKNLINDTKPQNIYTLSFENHYSLLLNIASTYKININLIDEGTATYKTRNLSEYYKEHHFIKKIAAKLLNVSASFKWYTNFEKVYAAFPEELNNTFKAKEYIKFFSHAGKLEIDKKTLFLINQYNISNNDFLYVNQRYAVQDKDFTNSIIEILNKISLYHNSKVFIKMHPKDNIKLIEYFKFEIKKYKNLVFIIENEFLIEPTIQAVKPKGVIGLTSTSLVYTSLISPNTKVFSIKEWFVDITPINNNKDGINLIKDHHKILSPFKHVINLKSELSIKNMFKLDTTIDTTIDTRYISIAQKAYEEKKYLKTIINYAWSCSNITNIPIDDFVKYIDAIYKSNSIEKVDIIFNNWVENKINNEKELKIKNCNLLFQLISTILSELIEFNKKELFESIYNNLLSIFTFITNDICNIDKIAVMLTLKDSYANLFDPLLKIEIKQLMINSDFENAYFLLKGISNEYLNHLTCLIELNKTVEIINFENNILTDIDDLRIKSICQSLISIYNKDYNTAIPMLTSDIKEFNKEELVMLKPELILAKAYRLDNDYSKAKVYLLKFEKHSKGNILAHREIAQLEYQFEYYLKAMDQFEKGYPGMKDIPIDDFVKYIDSVFLLREYRKINKLLKGLLIENYPISILYINLICLENTKNYEEIIKIESSLNLSKILDTKIVEDILWVYIRIHRILGNFDISLSYLNKYNLEPTKLKNLLVSAELFELSNKYEKALENWKQIIKYYSETMPIDSWNRYYNLVNLFK